MGDQKKKMGTLDMNKIYILHGWTYSIDKWNIFSELLTDIGIEPVFLKIPGLTSKSNEVWNIEKYAEWLDKQLSSQKDKVIILGHSNGGRIASYFAFKNPHRIRKLILMDTAGVYHKELSLEIKRFLFNSAAKIGKKLTSSSVLKKFLYRLAGEKDYQEATPEMKQSMLNLIKFDSTPIFEKIEIPTLIIWGEEDRVTPLSDALLINKLIKNSNLKIIKDAKHSPFYTHPREVVKIIKNDL